MERVLAVARVFLAISSLIAIYLDPTEPSRYATLAYGLLIFYVLHSLVVLLLLRARDEVPSALRLLLHVVDILAPAALTLFTEGPNSPFFVIFLFVLLAAAYRWGFWETLATAGAAILVLFAEVFLITSWPGHTRHFLEGQFELNRFVMRSAYLLIMGFLLGYMAEQEKQLEAETTVIARGLGMAQPERGLRRTLEALLDETLRLFSADRALIAAQETNTGRVFLWDGHYAPGSPQVSLSLTELDFPQRELYLFPSPMHSWHVVRRWGSRPGETFDRLALDSQGRRMRKTSGTFPDTVLGLHAIRSLLAVSFSLGEEWVGRVFLLDPRISLDREAELRFAQTLIRQVTPAVYSVYLLRRLRARAGAMERARVARELHDGAIQSLISVEMQVQVLRQRADGMSPRLGEELTRIQKVLRQEVLNLRELMEYMKPLDLTPKQLLDFLADLVEKFRRETGIDASFICDPGDVSLPPRICRELARITQEALANVRRHSGARNVVVRFGPQDGNWKLVIDDDGCGFDFAGHLSQAELDAARKGPVAIKERVRSIGGELTVESAPGRGVRLEITIPQKTHA